MLNNNFTILTLAASFLVAGFSTTALSSEDANSDTSVIVDLAYSTVFIPEYGFDDNDNVQAVVEGFLPNSCYTLAQTDTLISEEAKTVKIKQSAIRSVAGICENEAMLPPDLAAQRYFWKVIDLGMLNEGQHQLLYKGASGTESKSFGIELAPSNQIDNMSYVQATNVFAGKNIPASQEYVEFRITGQLTSSCAELSDDYQVEKVNDVYVVMLHTFRSEEYCMPASRSFYRLIRVKTPEAGRYLLHVRSIGGESQNSIFDIVAE